jgi:hypothetical protein
MLTGVSALGVPPASQLSFASGARRALECRGCSLVQWCREPGLAAAGEDVPPPASPTVRAGDRIGQLQTCRVQAQPASFSAPRRYVLWAASASPCAGFVSTSPAVPVGRRLTARRALSALLIQRPRPIGRLGAARTADLPTLAVSTAGWRNLCCWRGRIVVSELCAALLRFACARGALVRVWTRETRCRSTDACSN